MKKAVMRNFSIILLGYVALAVLANIGDGILKFMPLFVLIGTFTTATMMGYWMSQKNKKWLDGLFVALPYIIGSGVYVVARMMKHDGLIQMFRKILPHGYAQTDWAGKMGLTFLPREVQVIGTLLLMALISYGCIRLGMLLQRKETTLCKLFYNNILLWGIHFYVVVVLGILVQHFPKMLIDDQVRLISGGIVTIAIFILYFFIGRWVKNLKNPVLQLLSVVSVSVTALGMYSAGILLLYPLGRYEIYILPVAQSFFGLIGQKLAILLGAEAKLIGQYGVVVSVLMMMVPMILVYAGNRASRQTIDLESLAEGENNGEALSN